VRKGLVFLVSTHVALLGFILIATLAGHGQPLLPVQILWLELFIDLAASIAFEREAEEPNAMRRPPRPRDEPLLTNRLLGRIVLAGSFTALATLAVVELDGGAADHVRWLAYTALVVGQVVRAYANRSLESSVVTLRANWFLAATCLAVVALQASIPFIPPIASAFRASPLQLTEWGLITLIAFFPALVAEGLRRLGRTWVA
jgi:Ca2+-transporting ATPase